MEPLRVAILSQNQLAPREFTTEENGGFRLQPAAFAKTLCLWEQYFTDQRLEPDIDGGVQAVLAYISERDATETTPAESNDL